MSTWYEQVQEFAKAANAAQNQLDPERWPLIPESATPLSKPAIKFISRMLEDELDEFEEATTEYEQADALLDIIYYTLDTAAKHGLPITFEYDRMHETTPEFMPAGKVAVIANALRVRVSNIGTGDPATNLSNICYMTNRFADAQGYDLDPLFELVQEANMAKIPVTLDTDPESSRYGKVLKPEGWTAPDLRIKEALEAQKLIITDDNPQDMDEWLDEERAKAAKERGDDV